MSDLTASETRTRDPRPPLVPDEDRHPGVRRGLITYVSVSDLAVMWDTLREFGVDPDRPGCASLWLYNLEQPDGLPTRYRCALPDVAGGATVEVYPVKPGPYPHEERVALALHVECTPDEARGWMSRLMASFKEKLRMTSLCPRRFLDNEEMSWHTRMWPPYALVALNRAIEAELDGWQRVAVTHPPSDTLKQRHAYAPDGERVSVYSSARFFYRKDDTWAVLDLENNGTKLDIAATNLLAQGLGEDGNGPDAFMNRLEERVKAMGCLKNRKMTAAGEELELDRTYTWDELFLEPEVMDGVRQELEWFFDSDKRAVYDEMGLPRRRGLILYGPPGTGKTLLGKVLASQLTDATFVWITADDVSRACDVAELFRLARTGTEVLLFFEDFDLYASHRETSMGASPLGELLVQLDGMHSNDGIMIIATTNDLESIEPALRDRPSRFDRLIQLAPPSEPVRLAHLRHLLREFDVDDQALATIAADADGLTGAQLQELTFVARRRAIDNPDRRIGYDELKRALVDAARYQSASLGFGG